MSAFPYRLRRLCLVLAAPVVVAGCASVSSSTERAMSAITPYRVPVVQGNFVSREQFEVLRPGMSRQQVREILGTPLLTSVFHADRWDYVFTLHRDGVAPQSHRLTVFFSGDSLQRFESADTLPSESEFVALLDRERRKAKVPVLEATEEQLARFPAPKPEPGAAAQPATPEPLPSPNSYPPLEPSGR